MFSKKNSKEYSNLPAPFERFKKVWETKSIVISGTFDNVIIDLNQLILYRECMFHDCKFTGSEYSAFFYMCSLVDCHYPEEILTTSLIKCHVSPNMIINEPVNFYPFIPRKIPSWRVFTGLSNG